MNIQAPHQEALTEEALALVGRLHEELDARRRELLEARRELQGRLMIRVTAPPIDGRANAAVCRLIAKAAGIQKGRVSVTSGEGHRDKVVTVEDLTDAELRSALGL